MPYEAPGLPRSQRVKGVPRSQRPRTPAGYGEGRRPPPPRTGGPRVRRTPDRRKAGVTRVPR